MADRTPTIYLNSNELYQDLNLLQSWRDRQDRRDQAEWAAGVEAAMAPQPAEAPAKQQGASGGAEVQPPDPTAILDEKPVKKAVDELAQYREMRASEGPEGGVYDATKLGRSGWKDEVAHDPVAALMKLVEEATRFSSPDIKGGTPSTPGDVKNIAKSLKTASEALKRMTGIGQAAQGAAQAVQGEVAVTNVARVDASQSVKATMQKLNTLLGKPKVPAVATHAETVAGAENALTLEEALQTPDAAWSLEEMRFKQQKLRDLHAGLATEVDRLVKAVKNGDQTAAETLVDAFLLAGAVGNKDRAVGTGAGRLLEARKILADAERAGLATTDLESVVERLGLEGATTVEDIARVKAQMLAEGIDGTTIANMLDSVPKGQRKNTMQKVWNLYKVSTDALHYVWLQNLLSNPVSHAANVLGSGAATAWHYPERYVAEWINRVFRKDPAGVQRGETWQMMRASGKAAVDGFKLMRNAILKGEQPLGKSNVEAHFDLKASQFGWDENAPLGKFVDTVGMVMPTRLMMAEDGFFKGFNKTQELAALALREGMARAKDGESIVDLAKRVASLEAKPTVQMIQEAEAAAHLRTLNAELGPAGKAMMTARNLTPGGWVVMPFFQTPTNGMKWAWQRTPILSMTSAQNMKDIAAGGAARDLAISRILIGHAIGGAIAYQVVQGNITGAMPVGSNRAQKRDAKALGVEPFSTDLNPFCVRCGDEWFGYKRTDPVGQYIGTIATGIEIYSQLHHDDPHAFDYGDFVLASGLAASRVALDTPWLQGLGNVFHAIEQPDTGGKKAALGLAQSIVPAGIRQGTRTGFFGLTEPRPEMRELETLLDAVKAGLPGFVNDVPPRLHPITGDTVVYPPGWGPDMLSPIFVSKRNNDPVLLEIITHGMEFKEPSKMAVGADDKPLALDPTRNPEGVKLTPGQYFRLKQLATTDLRDGQGRTMHDAMVARINSEEYRRASAGPDNGKEAALKDIYRDFYRRANNALLQEYPSLAQRVDEKRRLRIRQQLPETSPDAAPSRVPGLPQILIDSLKP